MKTLHKVTFFCAFLEPLETYCAPGKEKEAIAAKLDNLWENSFDYEEEKQNHFEWLKPYFTKAIDNGGYFRGEEGSESEKVKAFVEFEEIEVFQ